MTRHRHARVLVPVVVGLIVAGAVPAQPDSAPRPVVFRTRTMGTWASLTMVTADSAAVAGLAFEGLRVLHRVDSLMSNWTETSEVARINREAGREPVVVHPEVADVIACARRVTHESGGAFDITVEPLVRLWGFLAGTPHVPGEAEIEKALWRVGDDKIRFDEESGTLRFARDDVRIDLGGIAKGYGVDRVSALLDAAHATRALIDLSGNMVARGDAAAHAGWTVGVRDPDGRRPYLLRINLTDEAVATSGDYEQFVDAAGKRYGHILDPRTGWSARGLSSVTVVAGQAMVADAWATALFVLGPDAARETAHRRSDLGVILVEPQANGAPIVWIEEQLRHQVQFDANTVDPAGVRYF
jgi:thiamine biosynthesis lipoprotein